MTNSQSNSLIYEHNNQKSKRIKEALLCSKCVAFYSVPVSANGSASFRQQNTHFVLVTYHPSAFTPSAVCANFSAHLGEPTNLAMREIVA